jgi:hypothetical protein
MVLARPPGRAEPVNTSTGVMARPLKFEKRFARRRARQTTCPHWALAALPCGRELRGHHESET